MSSAISAWCGRSAPRCANRSRFGATIAQRDGSRSASLLYLERLRLVHAVLTAVLTAGIIGWGILLWQHGQATVGDIVLITSLAFGILHGTRDLAVALVDLTQHLSPGWRKRSARC